jgi:hypothetical protein
MFPWPFAAGFLALAVELAELGVPEEGLGFVGASSSEKDSHACSWTVTRHG